MVFGWRAVVFVSGCPHHCVNCHNAEAQDYNYGTPFNHQEIIEKIVNNSILNGVTLTGGEPLSPENVSEILKFIKLLKSAKPSLNIWCYTGYTYENLIKRNDAVTNETLRNLDVLIDGPFIEEQKNPTLKFRGSENQRIIDVRKTLEKNKIVLVNV